MTAARLPELFVFGLGYTALRFVELHGAAFSAVAGTVRSEAKARQLRQRGLRAFVFGDDAAAASIARAGAVLVSIPPQQDSDPIAPRQADPVLAAYGAALEAMKDCRWVGYLSTTGVYGDRQGQWTDETAPPRPLTAQAASRAAVERAWLEWGGRRRVPAHIFRLAGIYGPGRNALAALRQGTARRIVRPGQVFNRIHVDDIARVLRASIAQPRAGAVYNVADDEPAPPQEVIAYAAALAGIAPPPEIAFEDAALSPQARGFYEENKRICNRLIRRELGVALAYPSYREGLQALLAVEGR